MYRTIEKINKKPANERKRLAFLGATVVTGVLVFVWGVTLPARLSTGQTVSTNSDSLSLVETVSTSPFRSIRNSITNLKYFNKDANQAAAIEGSEVLSNEITETQSFGQDATMESEVMPVHNSENSIKQTDKAVKSQQLPFLPNQNSLLFLP